MLNHQQSLLSISDASNTIGVSIGTIRRWEKKDLIQARRDSLGHRLFDRGEVQQVKQKKDGGGDIGYKVLKASKKTKYKVVELFAGCGGLALGLENAGLGCRMLVEIDKNAVETIKA